MQSLLHRIREGTLKAGDRLPNERDLAVEFGVSRPVIREAISHLAGRGVVAPRGGSGSTITAVAPERAQEALFLYLRDNRLDYRSIHEVRGLFEAHAAGIAATRATAADIEALRQSMRTLRDSGDHLAAAADADAAFHTLITRIAGNQVVELILSSLHTVLLDVRKHNLAQSSAYKEAVRSHQAILDAIVDGDETGARVAMSAHLDAVFQYWQENAVSGSADQRP
ncbi:GntR family transcriptional repressor for pyruvate dehydrogenase complex [Tamaricihabitans halophyticus]|uniref:GntR family transcriptional repressor for pyruvate dehydrogenase complex n=1 Tax=Tamaricihabitans halophyticus TaxID=1262583 RepID=A0A4V2SQH0_9PSEU|nr:FadR/GntR family transcriptional regulator [Tamaricihabitans halophyticus]TCP39056.1 GntR family transcriptional repressor for pyruvate dehydrogenase complex [Tamaricihabitans halophyticus]